jgi:hypothetical protein
MKIKDIFSNYEKCKLCKLNNVVIFRKHREPISGSKKTEKKNHYTRDFIEHIDNTISIIEEGAHHTKISELIIDMNTDTCKGSEVSRYEYLPFFLSIKMCCTKQISRDFDYDDYVGTGLQKLYQTVDSDKRDIVDNTHYTASFDIQIEQKAKEIISAEIISEIYETNDFTMNIDYANDKTKIIRKEKIISLPFILEKSITDFDFEAVLNNTKLLK